MFKDSFVLHLAIDSSVSSRGEGNVALAFDDDSAVVEEGRNAALREKNDRVFIIAEVVVGDEVVHDFLMVHFAGHEIPLNEGAFLAGALADEFVESSESVGEESEEGQAAFEF